MKKVLIDFIIKNKGRYAYSGNEKTMFVSEELHVPIIQKFGYKLPFKIGIY